MLALEMLMLPRDSGVRSTGWRYPTSIGFSGVENGGVPKGAAETSYSTSGQSAGKVERSLDVEMLKFARDAAGSFSQPR